MAASVQSKAGDIVADMNTTPLIDVMLVLLTLLIITLPMQTHAIKIAMPMSLPFGPPPIIVKIGIDFDGATTWNGKAVDRVTLDSYLADAARKNPQPDIVIRADKLASYDQVATVLAEATRSGETNIGFDETNWH
jgi:biopolymer transport protein ExbD